MLYIEWVKARSIQSAAAPAVYSQYIAVCRQVWDRKNVQHLTDQKHTSGEFFSAEYFLPLNALPLYASELNHVHEHI